jgi:indole-3-acetate monooxygenase
VTATPKGLVAAAVAAQPALAAEAEVNERARGIGPATVALLRSFDAFRMFVPARYGGPEIDPLSAFETVAAVSRSDAAAGWCATIASQTSHIAGSLDAQWAETIFRPSDAIACGAFAPQGRGRPIAGGHVVDGSWSWGSGTHIATWISGGTMTESGEFHQMLFPASAVTFEDTWYSAGLAGTASNDFSVTDEFVPHGRSVRFGHAKPTCDSPIARTPGFVLFAGGVASVLLGIAERAVEEIEVLAGSKRPAQSSKTLSTSPIVQADLARASAAVRSARVYLFHEVAQVWASVLAGDRVSVEQRLAVRLAASHVAGECVRVVDSCFAMGGGSAVYASSPLQRCLRDAHTAAAHIMVSARTFETVGRHRLGLEIDLNSL